ncbi:1%2C4-alpha-glucan branching enzyme GlgB [Blautia hydrogenotrophica]|uniref:1,4-alpha-glucan branching enzyme n=1 Tax=Blautia hydrogenotrophica TaxID=53443 RepID=UPI0006C43392|nr:1,4-alpha-glucan branching enzyme [Blautia hydrogenotrophica]CUM72661.1 1%2C4-alpha-glucan branching enzyme GlgB [Blautia hydrogenotrophica]SCI13052.1 1%2C4-alpha-glucan branching enzyme GlgB [uncultured Blautia sp.]
MKNQAYEYMNWPRIEGILYGEESSPRDVMQPRTVPGGVLVQGYFPGAAKVTVRNLKSGQKFPMSLEEEAGYFAAILPYKRIPSYEFLVENEKGQTERRRDLYSFPSLITEEDEKKFCAGIYYEVYKKLGAHHCMHKGVEGTSFAVWAPNALHVSVVGDFNQWDGRGTLMHRCPMSGIYELFIPDVKPGALYKYEIKVKGGNTILKADPYGQQSEMPPATASVVPKASDFQWEDQKWMEKRKKYVKKNVPISIYEVNPFQWKTSEGEKPDSYQSLGRKLAEYVSEMGYTHVELTPVMEYLDEKSSGYVTFAYYSPSRRLGEAEDFKEMVSILHQAGVGVILDWTPAQFSNAGAGLALFDGTCLYEPEWAERKFHPVWGTYLYKYGSPMVKNFLIANAWYWLEQFHVDGLRMDDVDVMLYLDYGRRDGEWLPNMYGTNENLDAMEFLKHLNSIVKKKMPEVLLIAQEDGLWPDLTDSVENDHLGFDYKWSGGWTKDFLNYLSRDSAVRGKYHDELTLSMLYAYCEEYVLTLASRDVGNYERFLKRIPGTDKEKEATVRVAYGYLMTHPGKKMQAMDASAPAYMQEYVKTLNQLYRSQPALYQKDDETEGFEWIQLMKAKEHIITFLRKTGKPEETLLVICNFSTAAYDNYSVGVPYAGKYKEVLNSDHEKFGGSGVTNPRIKMSKKVECDERNASITVKVPPLGISVYAFSREVKKVTGNQGAKRSQKKTTRAGKKNLKDELAEKIRKESE